MAQGRRQDYAWPTDKELVALVNHCGSMGKAADELGVAHSTIQKRLQKRGLRDQIQTGKKLKTVDHAAPISQEEMYKQRVGELEKALKTKREADTIEERLLAEVRGLVAPARPIYTPPKLTNVSGQKDHVHALLLSDLHCGEVISPEAVNGLNEFNWEILKRRMASVQKSLFAFQQTRQFPIKELHLWLLGDNLSGNIHDELAQTNEFPVSEQCFRVGRLLAEWIEQLVPLYERIIVTGVSGNHPRVGKPHSSKQVFDSFDWLSYMHVETYLERYASIECNFPRSGFEVVTIADMNILLWHGDGVRSSMPGVPWGGVMRRWNELRKQYGERGQTLHGLALGHFHQCNIVQSQVFMNGCFPARMQVSTPSGPRSIADMKVGDVVLSRNGTWQEVLNRTQQVADQGLVQLKINGLPTMLEATPNHEIWAMKGTCRSVGGPKWWRDRRRTYGDQDEVPQWIPAGYLSPGDWVHVPSPPARESEPFDEEEAWLYGLYLAEGHTLLDGGKTRAHNRIGLSMHRRELIHLERAARILQKLTGRVPRIVLPNGRPNSAELVLAVDRETALDWRNRFGYRSHGKRFPESFHDLSPRLKHALVSGWHLGDGHVATHADGSKQTSTATTSERLAWGMFYLAASLNMNPGLQVLRAGGPRKRDAYTVKFLSGQEMRTVDGEMFYRVKYRFRVGVSEPVYDLEISGEHTYTVAGVGVHNSVIGTNEFGLKNFGGGEKPTQLLLTFQPDKRRLTDASFITPA